MTAAESCAMRLLRLCATPGKSYRLREVGYEDALGNKYEDLFKSLQMQGLVKIETRGDSMIVSIV